MTKLKIFVSYKFKHPILENEIVTPIQTGRAISDEIFDEMIGDNTGDNISDKNSRYCELTAQYWVWKNYHSIGNPDYVGFMHYRRQFIFDENLKHSRYLWLPGAKFFFVSKIYKGYMKHFTGEKIYPYLSDNPDCITFQRVNVRAAYIPHGIIINNMREHFRKGLLAQKLEVFDVFEDVIKELYPEYRQTFEEFKQGTTMFCCNSFIMPKKLFFEYSDFLFTVLKEVDRRVDSSGFDKAESRFLGFLGEYMLSIFLMQKLKNPDFKLIELDGTYVNDGYKKIRRKIIKYSILSRLTFGKKKKYYLKKLARNHRKTCAKRPKLLKK